MELFTSIIDGVLSAGTLALQTLTVVIVILMARRKPNAFLAFLAKRAHLFVFLLSLSATVFSLVYSEVIGFAPCILCIIQRWFMYPQALIFGYGALRPARWVPIAGFALSGLGGLVSLYHNWLDWGGASLGICSTGDAVSCTQRFVYEFGYVTIPMMTLTVFILMIVLLLNARLKQQGADTDETLS